MSLYEKYSDCFRVSSRDDAHCGAWRGTQFSRTSRVPPRSHLCVHTRARTRTATLRSGVPDQVHQTVSEGQTLRGLVITDQGHSPKRESKSHRRAEQRACGKPVFPGHCRGTWGVMGLPFPQVALRIRSLAHKSGGAGACKPSLTWKCTGPWHTPVECDPSARGAVVDQECCFPLNSGSSEGTEGPVER